MRLSAENKVPEAIEVLEDYLVDHEADGQAHFELGKLRWATNQSVEAARSF